jgi:hypothetical protein
MEPGHVVAGAAHTISDHISDWRIGAHEGWRPATVFKATLVESDRPLLLSNVDVPNAGNSVILGKAKDG